jgi:hypothetical protein
MASIPYVNSAALRTGENGNSSAQLRRTESALGPAQAEEGPMTVFVYVNTSKQVGDKDHIKVLQTRTPRKPGSRQTTQKASRSSRP